MIWYFRGNQSALDFISEIPYELRLTSGLCVMELIQGCLGKEEIKTVRKFIKENICAVLYPNQEIIEKAMLLLERYASSDGLRTIDAIIAATALSNESSLATCNFKHFKSIAGLKTIKFRPL